MQEVRVTGAQGRKQVLGLRFQKEAAIEPQGLERVYFMGDTSTPQWLVRNSGWLGGWRLR